MILRSFFSYQVNKFLFYCFNVKFQDSRELKERKTDIQFEKEQDSDIFSSFTPILSSDLHLSISAIDKSVAYKEIGIYILKNFLLCFKKNACNIVECKNIFLFRAFVDVMWTKTKKLRIHMHSIFLPQKKSHKRIKFKANY